MAEQSENPVQQTLISVVEQAKEAGLLNFLVIGGNAVIAFGVPRFTRDIDFVIPSNESREWRLFLEGRGFQFIHGTNAFAQFQDVEKKRPRVDLMLVDASTWEKLNGKSVQIDFVENFTVPLPAVEHLIAMKLSAYRASQRRNDAVDWSDIVELTRRWKLDPEEDQEFIGLVSRYGGEDSLNRLKKDIADESK